MTRKERLLALAERCEEAPGPDRDLDCEIFVELNRDASVITLNGMIIDKFGFAKPVERCTASLDAAVTLVPSNTYWEICGDNSAMVRTELDCDHLAFANSPALALCAAALRAHADEAVE